MILLDPSSFVIQVQGGDDALRNDARAETSRRPLTNTPFEDELHMIGPADVQVFLDDLLEEYSPGHRLVQDLRE